jgi:hypothetical protein
VVVEHAEHVSRGHQLRQRAVRRPLHFVLSFAQLGRHPPTPEGLIHRMLVGALDPVIATPQTVFVELQSGFLGVRRENTKVIVRAGRPKERRRRVGRPDDAHGYRHAIF